ncbi:nuclear transport factor 2 family protein [Blastopirellula sp. JC732]|uniref:Nuclear transport factor 2 family protein n=1 Tax=Blastopirellula sediminis TaxID=2894196 RepID=A0A9X1MKV7_9BACT|nr:SgcJ/EcaC family oxidoreductase [Blastopirellula sediminis]MCC9609143.1 nuclear transport factor 2 family protein [Blastopirellula sediminis]MCC9628080.1 nuclear transport factor 2 family protein [Blastopirellula sediminis]
MTRSARILLALLLLSTPVYAQDAAPTAKPATEAAKPDKPADAASAEVAEKAPVSEDETAILAAIESYVIAFNKGDAATLASHWTPEGVFTTPSGETLKGRKALTDSFAAYFSENKEAKIELLETAVSLVSPSVANEVGIARVIVPGGEPTDTTYAAIHVKTSEGWKIDSIAEQEPEELAPTHYDQLKELEWMVGQWVDADENSSIESTTQWTKNRNFITTSFKVTIEGVVEFEGTQIIGWDPYAQTIRSWLFDSDGGFGAGRWTNQGDRWTVQTINVLSDGRRGTATNIYEKIDENTMRFESIGRQVDGELMPSIEPVTVTRVVE